MTRLFCIKEDVHGNPIAARLMGRAMLRFKLLQQWIGLKPRNYA